MKKLTSILLSMTLILTLAACGGGGNGGQNKEAPDLNQYYEDFMASLGADNQPAMGDVEGEQLAAVYPGLENYATKQAVLKMAMISAVAFEFALVELENEADAKAVADIFQARIDYQIRGVLSHDAGGLGAGRDCYPGERGRPYRRPGESGSGGGCVQRAVCVRNNGGIHAGARVCPLLQEREAI